MKHLTKSLKIKLIPQMQIVIIKYKYINIQKILQKLKTAKLTLIKPNEI